MHDYQKLYLRLKVFIRILWIIVVSYQKEIKYFQELWMRKETAILNIIFEEIYEYHLFYTKYSKLNLFVVWLIMLGLARYWIYLPHYWAQNRNCSILDFLAAIGYSEMKKAFKGKLFFMCFNKVSHIVWNYILVLSYVCWSMDYVW